MSYYLAKTLSTSFEDALTRTTEALKAEGFGVITQIDIRDTLKRKINADFRPYTILGGCNPALAFEALKLEDKVGTMLPCNVIVQGPGKSRLTIPDLNSPVAARRTYAPAS